MRAYISRTDVPLARVDAMFRARMNTERGLASLAEQEAERILADTEAQGEGWGKLPYPTMHPFKANVNGEWIGEPVYLFAGDTHYNRAYCNELRFALADALEAWIGDEA